MRNQIEIMSYLLPHLRNGWAVDQAILSEEDRVVVIRFGSDADDTCMRMDEVRRNERIKSRRVHDFFFIVLDDD